MVNDLLNIYVLFIRSRLEQSAVVRNSSITVGEELELKMVQKVAFRLILKENYLSYTDALVMTNMETLKTMREHLFLKFARKCAKSEHSSDLFPLYGGHHYDK